MGVICLYFARLFNFENFVFEKDNEENELEKEENIKEIFLKNNENENDNQNSIRKNFIRKNTGELPVMQYNFREKSKMITKLFGRISNV